MTLNLEFPQCVQGPLGRLDPRWKLAALVPAAFALALMTQALPVLAGMAGALVLVMLARIPRKWYLGWLALVGFFLLLFLVWVPFFPAADEAVWRLGPLVVSQPKTLLVALLTLRALAMVSLILVLLTTAPLQNTLKAAHALHVPGLIVHLVLLSYRYIFLLGEEFSRLRTALRVRGFRNRPNMHSYRTIGQVTGSLLVRGHERAERVGQAMRCRGFDGVFRSLHDFRTRPIDVIAWLLIVATAAALLAWDRLI